MKLTIIHLILVFLMLIYLFLNRDHCSNTKAKIYSINNKNYCLLTASNQEQWQKGLMFYKKPVNFDGMIFLFPDKQMRNFWNKNTYVDLDIYWMNGDMVVGKNYLPSILKTKNPLTVKSSREVDRVIEIIR